jgi:NO-binding membrane sensor protein with MHYT domain
MQATYNTWLVGLSIVVAMAVAYTALRLVSRVTETNRSGKRAWLMGGAIVMGMGIWSMHFIGMLAFSLPVPIRYSIATTLGSLGIAILTSGFALALASRPNLQLKRLLTGASVMGAGICAMHYSGMAAIEVLPMITYEPWLVGASVAIAVSASFAALWLAFQLRSGQSWLAGLARVGAAIVMGLAISGMHYTAMAAARFSPGSICSGGTSLDNGWFAGSLGLIALSVLAITLITAVYDAHLESRTLAQAQHLERVNTELQHGKKMLTLATQAAGITSWEFDLATRTTLWRENEIEALRDRSTPAGLTQTDSSIHPDDMALAEDAIRAAHLSGQERCSYRLRSLSPTGATVYVQSHARVVCDAAGQPARLLGVSWDVTEQVVQEEQRRQLEAKLRNASREAGMAEVATGVLHSVGNVLNSLGVSTSVVQSQLRDSHAGNVHRTAQLLLAQGERLGSFLDNDERGRTIPAYLAKLGEYLNAERDALAAEADAIAGHLEHVRTIVAAQQAHARRGGTTEIVDMAELLDHAIALHFTAVVDVQVRREYATMGPVTLDRHKVLQILGNLFANARHALNDGPTGSRQLTARLSASGAALIIEIADSGIGMSGEALGRLFELGFTTKKNGHGFGLHTSAILAKELGGDLTGASGGPGCGARFTLRLPIGTVAGVEDKLVA